MTNYEHYKSEIEKIARLGWTVGVDKDGKPHACNEMYCNDCITERGDCYQTISKWADSEYIEQEVDWIKIPVDTPILVSDDKVRWRKRYFAEYTDKKIYVFADGRTSWTACSNNDTHIWKYAKLQEVDNGI